MLDRGIVTLEELLGMRDEIGVITVTAGFAPSSYGDGPTGPDAVRAQLRKLGAGTEHEEAVADRVAALSHRIDALLDPRGEGRGRYLAAGVASGDVVEHRLQVALPAAATLDDGPTLRDLLAAFDEHEPAAAVLLHANAATLLQVGWNGHEAVRDWAIDELVLDDEHRGPGPAGPVGAGGPVKPGGVTHRDQQEDRLRAHQDRFLRDVAADVRAVVAERGLRRLVLVGPARERAVVADAIGTGTPLRLLEVDRVASGDLRATLEEVTRTLSDEHAAFEEELVTEAHDRARASGRGALGAAEVTAALIEGRVEHLLLSPDVELRGWISEDGHLVLDEDDPSVAAATPEPRFVHRMIERAMATDSSVTPVDGAAGERLDELGGVAALLRW